MSPARSIASTALTTRNQTRRFGELVRVALAIVVLAVPAGCGGSSAYQLVGYRLDPPTNVATLSLPDAQGLPSRFVAHPHGILLVYFGYTNCPDLCPTTLADVREARKLLGPEGARVDVAMVTVDPIRDTAAQLDRFVKSFDSAAKALRTTDDRTLQNVASAFGADYTVNTAADGTEEVSHTSVLYAVDAEGAIVLNWGFGVASRDLASDLRELLRSARP